MSCSAIDQPAVLNPLALSVGTFYGVGAQLRVANDVRLSETVHAGLSATPRHSHRVSYFCYVLSGGFSERSARGVYDGRPGTLIFHPAGVWHEDRFTEQETRCLNIEVPDDTATGQLLGRAGMPSDGALGGRAHLFAAELARELQTWDVLSPLVAEGLILSLAAATVRGEGRRDVGRRARRTRRNTAQWTDEVVEVLRASLATPPTLSDLAATVGVSIATVHRGFLRRFGCTVGDFIRRERIEAARRALLAGEAPLGQIAFAFGFADQAHFTRLFRRATGWTPAAYRRIHRAR